MDLKDGREGDGVRVCYYDDGDDDDGIDVLHVFFHSVVFSL